MSAWTSRHTVGDAPAIADDGRSPQRPTSTSVVDPQLRWRAPARASLDGAVGRLDRVDGRRRARRQHAYRVAGSEAPRRHAPRVSTRIGERSAGVESTHWTGKRAGASSRSESTGARSRWASSVGPSYQGSESEG